MGIKMESAPDEKSKRFAQLKGIISEPERSGAFTIFLIKKLIPNCNFEFGERN